MDQIQKILFETIRIRHSLRQRMDGKEININAYNTGNKLTLYAKDDIIQRSDDDDWVTIKGTHVMLGEGGVAMGGGKLKGMTFSNAKSQKSGGSRAAHVERITRAKARCDELRSKMERIHSADRRNRALREFAEKDVIEARKHEEQTKRNVDFAKKMYEEHGQPDRSREDVEKEAREARDEARREYAWIRENKWKEGVTRDDIMAHEMKMESASKREDRANAILRTRDNYQNAMENHDRAVMMREKREKDLARMGDVKRSEEDQKVVDEYNKAAEERNASVLKLYKSPDDCKTSQEATDYLRAQGYYDHGQGHFDSDSRVDLDRMSNDNAVTTARHIDSLMKDYPGMRGQLDGIDCHDMSRERGCGNTLAYAQGTRICYNEKYYGENGMGPKAYERDVANGYHPKGTDFGSVVDHETAHAIAKLIQQRASQYGLKLDDNNVENTVMRHVQERLYGRYDKKREKEVRASVSGYASNNKGVRLSSDGRSARENKEYGRNTEFLAEGMAEARGSSDPRETARVTRDVLEDMMRRVKLK